MEKITKEEFNSRFKSTGVSKSAIFNERKQLMEEVYATGNPIYCDQSYYAQCNVLEPVKKNGEHFECSCYKKFEDWRDCHYYSEYVDADGNKAWLMTGGRYD